MKKVLTTTALLALLALSACGTAEQAASPSASADTTAASSLGLPASTDNVVEDDYPASGVVAYKPASSWELTSENERAYWIRQAEQFNYDFLIWGSEVIWLHGTEAFDSDRVQWLETKTREYAEGGGPVVRAQLTGEDPYLVRQWINDEGNLAEIRVDYSSDWHEEDAA